MSYIKKILGLESFSTITGYSQPPETCPMIDNHKINLEEEIASEQASINQLESELSDLDEESTSEKANLEEQITKAQALIDECNEKLTQLEDDRKLIHDVRQYSLANRYMVLSIIDDALVSRNSIYYLYTSVGVSPKKLLKRL